MNRAIRLSIATLAVVSTLKAVAHADDAPATHETQHEASATATITIDGTPATPATPFTGAEEPRPGQLLVGRLNNASRTERAAFLGVGATAVDAALRSQLDLPRGVGLVVGYIEKGSPADQAGVQQHDIIEKLNDQLLVNTPQLATLVRTFKDGDEVTLTIVRKGKPQTLTAKLVERDMPPLADAGNPYTINFATEPLDVAANALGAAERMQFAQPGAAQTLKQSLGERINAEVRKQIDGAINSPRIIHVSPDSTRIISRDDGTLSIQVTQHGDSKSVTIHDAAGKVLFDGPYNTDDDAAKMPDEWRKKVKQMLDGIEIKSATPTTGPSEPKAEAEPVLEAMFCLTDTPR